MTRPETREQWLLVLEVLKKIQDLARVGDWDGLRAMCDSGDVLSVDDHSSSGLVVEQSLSEASYLLSEPSGSGYRVVLGFETEAQAHAAHSLLARQRAAAQQAKANADQGLTALGESDAR